MRTEPYKINLVIQLLLLFLNQPQLIDSYVVCSSIDIQGPASLQRFKKIRNCNIVVGHIRILNARFDNTSSLEAFFPHLTEITDYLLVFQAHNLPNLSLLFPKLTLIRGDHLFRHYSLVIFLANSLLRINLPSLVSLQKGSVLLSRLYHTCYIDTIDWRYLIKDSVSEITKTLVKNDCYTQICPTSCKTNCWSKHTCQLKCPSKCSNNCDLKTPEKCCTNPLCLHCLPDASCVACSTLRDLQTGQCVKKCPANTVEYRSHSCLKLSDCSSRPSVRSLIKNHHILNYTHCVHECPDGYKPMPVQLNASKNISVCMECGRDLCKLDCSGRDFHLRTARDMDSIRDCFRVKSLHIEFRQNVTRDELDRAFRRLEVVEEYLVLVRNQHIVSLDFLKHLRYIGGQRLYEQRFALFVHTNEVLYDLWHSSQFRIRNGAVKFFENPKLCYNEIMTFLDRANATNNPNSEVSFNFNGYKRFTCSNQTIDLNIQLFSGFINTNWNVTIADLRRLKGFTLSYAEVPPYFIIDQNDIDNGFLEWNALYIEYTEEKVTNLSASIEVHPFTRYAIYIKADLTHDDDKLLIHTSMNDDKTISKIYYVYSLSDQPSRVTSISYTPLSFSEINLKWEPPKHPNGVISMYFIAHSYLDDWEQFPTGTDTCQFVSSVGLQQQKMQDIYTSTTRTTTNTTTTTTTKSRPDLAVNSSKSEEACHFVSMNKSKMNRFNDNQKNDLISVEDEIYNLAFKPAKRRPGLLVTKKQRKNRRNAYPMTVWNSSSVFSFYNMTESLINLVKQDLFIENNDQKVSFLTTSNETLNVRLVNLTSFRRYIVSVIACQNFTDQLIDYASKFQLTNSMSPSMIVDYLSFFPLVKFCSKASLITFRSLTDRRLDQVTKTSLVVDSGVTYFKWSEPSSPNGFIFKYNLKFVDTNINKTQGPLCYSDLKNLKVALNQFLLTEGHEYKIHVQAVSNAGPGLWSESTTSYKVPNISHKSLGIILQIFGAILASLVLVLVSVLVLRNFLKSKENGYFSHYYYFRPDKWEIKRKDIEIEDRIGSGCFAEVHRGKVTLDEKSDPIVCAIKFCGSDNQNRQRLLKEANMMKSINTTHIVRLLGIVSINNPAYLVLEYMEKGDLKDYLKNARNDPEIKKELSHDRLYRIAAEIADGMLWLSEHKYIHRDLAARNCLISKDNIIKIADLGLSKDIYQDPIYREKNRPLLPVRWMSPESLSDGSSSTKSDVWSYGVVLFELSSYGDNPYAGKENESVIKFVIGGGKLELPSTSPPKFFMLLNRCMVFEDFKRMNFKEILDTLDPELRGDFKKNSFYHNDFRSKAVVTRKPKIAISGNGEKKILSKANDVFDNYM